MHELLDRVEIAFQILSVFPQRSMLNTHEVIWRLYFTCCCDARVSWFAAFDPFTKTVLSE